MTKQEVLDKAKKYSHDHPEEQKAFLAGFQEVCNMIRINQEECYNLEFLKKMEELADVSHLDLTIEEDNFFFG